MTIKLFHDQSPRKYGTGIELATPGSAVRLHLLPDTTLPTALQGPMNVGQRCL